MYRVAFGLFVFLSVCQTKEFVKQHPWEKHGKLQISDNNHYLHHKDGTPFLWLGGTAWGMTEWMTREDINLYLDNRKEKGLNIIQICLVWGKRHDDPISFPANPPNAYGHRAFLYTDSLPDPTKPDTLNGGSPGNPNDYWDHVDFAIQAAAKRGMYIGLLPVWGRRYVNATQNNFSLQFFNKENARIYGKFLGERYRNSSNVIWVLGGDVSALKGGDYRPVYRTMAEGIILGITKEEIKWDEPNPLWDVALMTYHPDGNPNQNSSNWFHTDPWLDFNMIETYVHRDSLSKAVLRDYSLKDPVKPVVMGEGQYEGFTRNKYAGALEIRRQAYQTFFAGGAGHTYGAYRDSLNNGPLFSPFTGWKKMLNIDGINSFFHLKQLLTKYTWHTWTPDSTLLPSETRYSELMKTAVNIPGSNTVLVYFPDNSQGKISLKGKTSATEVQFHWFSTRNGEVTEKQLVKLNEPVVVSPPPTWEDGVAIFEWD